MGKAWTITDARGATVELWGGDSISEIFESLEPDDRKAYGKAVFPDDMKLKGLLWVSLYLLGICVFAALVAVLFVNFKPASWPSYLTAVIVALPVALVAGIVGRKKLNRSIHNPAYIDAALSINRCPACVYSLSGQQAEPDGCIVCPECGGAWRRPAR